jgi:hypothetical protein
MFKIWKLSNDSFMLVDSLHQITLGGRDSTIVTLTSLRVDFSEIAYMFQMFDTMGHTVADLGVCNTIITTQYSDPINIPVIPRGFPYAA